MGTLSHSRAMLWLRCRRAWDFHYNCQLEKAAFRPSLDYGLTLHETMPEYWAGKREWLDVFREKWDTRVEAIAREYDKRGWEHRELEDGYRRGMGRARYHQYQLEHVARRDIFSKYEPEVAFTTPLMTDWDITGRVDGLATLREPYLSLPANAKVLVEYKTTGRYAAGNVEIDFQQALYQQIHNRPTLYFWFTSDECYPIVFTHSDESRRETWCTLQRVASEIDAEENGASFYPAAPQGACYDYCDYGQLCILKQQGLDYKYVAETLYKIRSNDHDDTE